MSEVKKWKNIVENAMKVAENDMEDANHTDHEVSMAKSQLLSTVKSSVRIAKHLKDKSEEEGLEGWVASKLTMAEDYLQNVADYMDGNKIDEGYKVLPSIDKDKYQSRDGLEGPFSTLSGKVVYYDPKEGKYYDPDTDMYMSYEEFQKLDNDYTGMKTEEKGGSVARGRAESVKNIDNILVKMGADAPSDIIADIMHWIDAHPGEDLGSLIKQAEGYYQDELDESASKIDEGYEGAIIHALQQHDINGFFNKGTLYIEDGADMNAVEEIVNQTVEIAPEIKPEDDYYKIEKALPEETVKYEDEYDDRVVLTIEKDKLLYNGKPIQNYDWNSSAKSIISDKFYPRAKSWEEVHGYLARFLGNPKSLQAAVRQVFNTNDEGVQVNETVMVSEAQFDEAAGEKDACYHKVKSRYKVWPSAYASGALVKCRKVGAKNWGNSKK